MSAHALEIGDDAMDELLDGNYVEWIAEAYGAGGIGVGGAALFVLFAGALGLYNWTETFKVPAVWLVLMTPLVATALPVPVVWRLTGLVTTALATLFLGLWVYWQRM
ncbi:MAG: hypothetical protein ACOCQY_05160 [Halorhabdus sp.]